MIKTLLSLIITSLALSGFALTTQFNVKIVDKYPASSIAAHPPKEQINNNLLTNNHTQKHKGKIHGENISEISMPKNTYSLAKSYYFDPFKITNKLSKT